MDIEKRPVGGEDYPRTFQEFDVWFGSEGACRDFLRKLRWSEGFCCPHCGSKGVAWNTGRGLLHCRSCQGQTSVTAGTIFEGTRKPLRTWFLAMWFAVSQKHGVSALGLQRVLGLGSYQTAWSWLHKLRRAMVRPGRDRLSGEVEVDETYVGAPEEDVHGRQIEEKAIVVVAAERRGKAIGRVRLRQITDCSSKSLTPFVCDVVAPGSTIFTDGWLGYSGLKKKGYVHQILKIKTSGKKAHELLPRVHMAVSHLHRWLVGTHHGSIKKPHLDYYLDEFTFRFNRRSSRARGLLFYRLVRQAVVTDPTPYTVILGGKATDNHNI